MVKQIKKVLAGSFKQIFRTLNYRNYRLFFFGQFASLLGTWMQSVAVVWLVYRLTNSAFLLGFTGFSSQIPAFLLSPFSGVLADRINRRKLFFISQVLAMGQSLLLAFLVVSGKITVIQIILLSLLMGLISAIDMPVRQAFVVDMVEKKEDLGNAIALNSLLMNATRLLGPAIAGILISWLGEAPCFFINSFSYIFIIVALLRMKLKPQKITVSGEVGIFKHIKEGFRYAYDLLPIRAVLVLLSIFSFFAMPYTIILPIVAREILHGGADLLGYLMGAVGLGALIGALFVASKKNVAGLEKLLSVAGLIFGGSICIFALSRFLWFSLIVLTISGFGMFAQITCSNTILQTLVDDNKRGRVMSLYTMAFMGMVPLGNLYVGSLAHYIGAPNTLIINGVILIVCSLVFIKYLPKLNKIIHPIYRQKGILPEIAEGLGAAAELTSKPED